MPSIALPAFHVTKTTDYLIKVGHELNQELLRYRDYYRQHYGADVSEADLIREMARRFMENDRAFQEVKEGPQSSSRRRRSRATPTSTDMVDGKSA